MYFYIILKIEKHVPFSGVGLFTLVRNITYHRACLINLRVFFKTYILLQNDLNIKLCDILKKKMSHAKTNLTAAPWCVSMTASKK